MTNSPIEDRIVRSIAMFFFLNPRFLVRVVRRALNRTVVFRWVEIGLNSWGQKPSDKLEMELEMEEQREQEQVKFKTEFSLL